jgi:hypothetical protein
MRKRAASTLEKGTRIVFVTGEGRTICCSRPATRMKADLGATAPPREPAAELGVRPPRSSCRGGSGKECLLAKCTPEPGVGPTLAPT